MALLEVAARAAPPRATCSASAVGDRVLVTIQLSDFFDDELLRLVRLGLEGRVRIEASLRRRRWLWFDQRVGKQTVQMSITFDRELGEFVIDGQRALTDPTRLVPERVSFPTSRRPEAAERYHVEIRARLQVVTASSLSSVVGWMAGRSGESAEREDRSLASRELLSRLVEDLQRAASARCDVEIRK